MSIPSRPSNYGDAGWMLIAGAAWIDEHAPDGDSTEMQDTMRETGLWLVCPEKFDAPDLPEDFLKLRNDLMEGFEAEHGIAGGQAQAGQEQQEEGPSGGEMVR